MIHYIYKICFLCEEPGNYYIGKRSYRGSDITKDKYCGSGKYCEFYFKKHGIKLGETYTKEIIEININKKTNSDRERYWVNDLWNTDPLCKNLIPGGDWSKNDTFKKAVIQYDLFGNEVARYDSQTEAMIAIDAKSSSGISKCCINRSINKEVKGYIWRFSDDPLEEWEKEKIFIKHMPIQQFSKQGEFIKIFENVSAASKESGVDKKSILDCCKRKSKRNSGGGFIWRYMKDSVSQDEIATLKFTEVVKIHQYDCSGNLINTFNSLHDAAKHVNGVWQCIQTSCNKKQFAYGFLWLRDGDDISTINLKTLRRSGSRTIYQYDLEGNFIQTFTTLREAALHTNTSWQNIQSCCNGRTKHSGGFIWKRDDWK